LIEPLRALFVLLVVAIVFVLVVGAVRDRRRRRRAVAHARSLSDADRASLWAMVDVAGGRSPNHVVLLAPATADARPIGWVGGQPSLPANASWPRVRGAGRASFVAQVELIAPPRSPTWERRSVAVFRAQDGLVATSFPTEIAGVSATHAVVAKGARPWMAIRAPYDAPADDTPTRSYRSADDVDAPYGFHPESLFASVPGLAARLSAPGVDPPRVLGVLLAPSSEGGGPGDDAVSVIGAAEGDWQPDEAPQCPVCRSGMRYLAQLATQVAVLPGAIGYVVSVYGCDAHVECVAAIEVCTT
jgi:hypothetical protein